MDMLFKRYACPFSLLDEYIASGRMLEFVDKFTEMQNEENENNTLWEFFLHKVYDKSYTEFLRENKRHSEPENTKIDFETTIQTSFDILQGFCPE